jgi:hypothetical protein
MFVCSTCGVRIEPRWGRKGGWKVFYQPEPWQEGSHPCPGADKDGYVARMLESGLVVVFPPRDSHPRPWQVTLTGNPREHELASVFTDCKKLQVFDGNITLVLSRLDVLFEHARGSWINTKTGETIPDSNFIRASPS